MIQNVLFFQTWGSIFSHSNIRVHVVITAMAVMLY